MDDKGAGDDELKNKDFYKILGVEKTASESQIKNCYRKLAMKYHPDKNPGNFAAAEKFKDVSIAYAVLSDPNKRRQYDISGPSGAVVDFEGIDVSEMGGVGRVFGALFTKLGVPVPTQISPKVLGAAKDLCEGRPTTMSARDLELGQLLNERVEKQEPHFYRIHVTQGLAGSGVVLVCRSPAMSKFKLILFDREGGVRQIQESQKRKTFTSSELYFVPFDRAQISELFPLKFLEDKEVPLPFHFLDGLEPSQNIHLEPGSHLLCVYGDNWFQDVKYTLRLLPAAAKSAAIPTIVQTEQQLYAKKTEMSNFQTEFVEAKKRFEEAVKKLESESKDILELMAAREKAYDDFLDDSAIPFKGQVQVENSVGKSFFSTFFGGK